MLAQMHRNQSVNVHQFAMVPKADIPRSRFKKPTAHKTTINAAMLVPIFLDEVVPGDTFELHSTMFARMSTPLYPIMDNLYLESFWFFVPMRLVWMHYDKFFGAQDNPADSTSYSIPVVAGPAGGYGFASLGDYFGLPTTGQVGGGNSVTHSALPFRAYNLIWNLWFRDENLQNGLNYGSVPGPSQWTNMDDGPDGYGTYNLQRRGKRHDYFTSCLPFTQKGTAVSIPLIGNATVKTNATDLLTASGLNPMTFRRTDTGGVSATFPLQTNASGQVNQSSTAPGTSGVTLYPANLYADLSTAAATTINALRLAFATQKVLERDARGGTRYQEKVFAHFGVLGPDARLMRPEYLGGSKQAVQIQPVPQTMATGATGTTTPMGTLAAIGHVLANAHWRQSFTEHGYIIGLISINADLSYQQGLRRLWTRSTQYDFYLPAFATLGEQTVQNGEIYYIGGSGMPMTGQDGTAFGYQERWAEMRYHPPLITGAFRSTYSTPLDSWHLAEKFTALPTLSGTFIQSSTDSVVTRAIAAGAAANGEQFIVDAFFDVTATRPLPLYSVPGMIDRF